MGGTRMNDEKEGELAKETFLKLGWDIYDERDVEVLSEAFKSHGKSCYERGRKTIEKELMCELRDPNGTIWECATTLQKENDRLKERVAELEGKLQEASDLHWKNLATYNTKGLEWEKKFIALEAKLKEAENQNTILHSQLNAEADFQALFRDENQSLKNRLANSWEKRTVEEIDEFMHQFSGYGSSDSEVATALVKFLEEKRI